MTLSLHERIRSDIETRILSGALAPGDRLPIEAELIQDYHCSRMTVNKALSALATAGLIERRKRAGTFVARPRLHAMVLDVPDLKQEVIRRGQTYGYRSLSRRRRKAARKDADEIALAGQGDLLELSGLHSSDGRPLALERRLISIAAVPSCLDADLESDPPGSWLLRHVAWTEAATRISAVGADTHTARILMLADGEPCLSIERSTWRGGEQITSVHQIFVAHSYDLVARFGMSDTRSE